MESAGYLSGSELKVDTIESVAELIMANKKVEGIVVVRSIPVSYNTAAGWAKCEPQEVSSGIHNEYNFTDLESLVEKAVSLIAKRDLLAQLATLEDKQIQSRIRANHMDPKMPGTLCYLTLDRVDVTLRQIQRSAASGIGFFAAQKPTHTQQAVAKALGDIDLIKGSRQVDDIMNSVKITSTLKPKL